MSTVTLEQVESCIIKEEDMKVGKKTTIVVLTLSNGFEVVGVSACVSPEKYDHTIGKTYARQRAVDKIWELEGYLLQTLTSKGSV